MTFSVQNMDPIMLIALVLIVGTTVCTILAILIDGVQKMVRSLILAVARVKVEKYRAMGRRE